MKLCVSLTCDSIEEMTAAAVECRARGAMVEVRLDCLPEAEGVASESFRSIVGGRPDETIFTWRRVVDGGKRALDDANRLAVVARLANHYRAWCDVEIDCEEAVSRLGIDRARLILSVHDFSRSVSPDDLYAALTAHDAGLYKVATQAGDETGMFAHFELLERSNRDGHQLVSIGMGAAGVPTRILGPAYGSAFTFAAATNANPGAPGQIALDDMVSIYRVPRIGRDTIVCGLIAGRTEYSLSPVMHNWAFARSRRDWVYVPFDVSDLRTFLRGVLPGPARRVAWPVRGFSVTNPFKRQALAMVDDLDPLARRTGAVNTIVVEGDRTAGFNTDVDGAMLPLERRLGSLSGLRIGVLGAGGAARAVVAGASDRDARCTVYARQPGKASREFESFGIAVKGLDEVGREALDVVVNTTPLGTSGAAENDSPVSGGQLERARLAFDLVYNPSETRFLREARQAGCDTLGGLPMLATQAALQYQLWTGENVDPDLLAGRARLALLERQGRQ